jgi:hypothetical protein
MGRTVKEYSQMIGFLTRDKTSTVPRSMDQEPVTLDQGGRMGYLTGGQVKNENAWIKANPDRNWDDLSNTLKYSIRKTGRTDLGTVGSGAKPGMDNPLYKPLSEKGEKIAMKVYGTLDVTDDQRQGINSERITMDTKPVKMNKETDISVKSKKGQPPTSVDFKGLKMPDGTDMETAFMEDLKLRASEPEKAVLTNKYGNKYFADKYPISDRQLKRAIPFLMKQEGLEYPKLDESFAVRATRQRKEKLSPSSSLLEEGRISKAKTKILKEQNLARKIDTAHRVSKTHMNRLGLQFDTDLMGMDSRVINQVIIKPSEIKLDRLYRKQFDVFEKLKNNPTDALRTELNDINKQVKSIVKTTSGRLVGVTIDPNTLETSFEGLKKKYSLTQFMKENMTMKDLEKFDYNSPQQQEFLTKTLNKAVNAEVKKGFVPNDFRQILSDKKSREAILKYAQKKTPELVGKLKQAIKNPTSKVAMKVLSVPIMAGAVYNYGEDFLKGTGIVDREYEQTASAGDAPIVEKEFTTGQKVAGTAAAGVGAYKFGKPLLKNLGKAAGLGFGPTGMIALNAKLGVDPRETVDRIGLEAEAALAPSLVKGVTEVSSKIKNPMLKKGLETLAGVRIPGVMNPANAMKIARVASPLGIASLGLEGLYHLGKAGVAEKKKLNAMTDQEREDYLRSEVDPLMDEGGML